MEYLNRLLKIRKKGSFTVEAVYLVPVVILLIAFMFQLSIRFCGTIQTASEDVGVLQELDTPDYFLKGNQLDHIKDLLLGN